MIMEATLRDLQNKMGLQNWVITIIKDDELKQNAKTEADPRYCRATISISYTLLDRPQEWERVLIHELIHIVTSPYDFIVFADAEHDELLEIQREQTVSQLTEILLRAYGI